MIAIFTALLILVILDLIVTTALLAIVLKRAGYPVPLLRKREPKGPFYA